MEAAEQHDLIQKEVDILEAPKKKGKEVKEGEESEERSEEGNGWTERDPREEKDEESQEMKARGLGDETNDEGRSNERDKGVGDNGVSDREGQAEPRQD